MQEKINSHSKAALSQIPGYIFWKDLNSVYLGCNLAFAKAAGLNSPKDIIGKTDYDLAWAEEYANLYQQGDQEALDGVLKFNATEPMKRADGKLITVLYNKIPFLDNDGKKIGTLGNSIEILPEKPDFSCNELSLPPQQLECLIRCVKGMPAKQIAHDLDLSIRTVEYYLNILKIKLNCPSKAALIARALNFSFIKKKLNI